MMADVFHESATGCTVAVRLQPGAKKNAILGFYGEGQSTALKIAIQAPPIDGRANEAVAVFLADKLGVSKSSIQLVSGESSRSKVFHMQGMNRDAAAAALTDGWK